MTNNSTNSDLRFDNIHKDINCNCLENCSDNANKSYARRVGHPELKERDFKSKWEKLSDEAKEIEINNNDCKNLCGLKGVSCNEWNEYTKNKIIEKYTRNKKFSPKSKDGIIVFTINTTAGCIKRTPTNKDESHHDFYKCDSFVINNDLIKLEYKQFHEFQI